MVAACTPVLLADKESDAAGKRFDPPPSGLARLYVYQSPCSATTASVMGPAVVLNTGTCGSNYVFLRQDNQQPQNLGRVGSQNWLSVDVAPGDYIMWCDEGAGVQERARPYKVALTAGEQSFVGLFRYKQSDALGFRVDFICSASKVATQTGMAAVSERQRVRAP